jgi:N-acetyl-gamma-glutamyl-phosphate reductase
VSAKLKVAICGGSGYTGAELLRILKNHPKVKVTAVTSERSAGKSPVDLFGHLAGYEGLTYEPLDKTKLVRKADLFFMALPHAASQEAVDYFHKKGKRVMDLSADYRLKNSIIYEQWYKVPHKYPKTLSNAVYGLPELHRKEIRKTKLVAVPGCYPTSVILGLAPVVKKGLVDVKNIIIDSKSGTSGAGRKADVAVSFCEVNEGFKAYGIATHRHTPEIEQELQDIAKVPLNVNFTPHLLPVDRGILSTMYGRLAKRADFKLIYETYRKAYAREPFVRLLDPGQFPNIKHVRGTNRCDIGIALNERTNTLIVVSAIDNLVKGASGQAVQCMNLVMGYPERTGLESISVVP